VKALAKTINGSFARIQFTPDLMPADVTGHTLYDPSSGKFATRKGPIFAHFVIADEINRAPAKTQAALLEVMQERRSPSKASRTCCRNPSWCSPPRIPSSTKARIPCPTRSSTASSCTCASATPRPKTKVALTRQVTTATVGDRLSVETVNAVIDPSVVAALQNLAASLTVDDAVLGYAVRLARTTRDNQNLSRGAGPRASIALVRCARARALMSGRTFATPDDVKSVALAVLRHRVTVAPELEIEGRDADSVLTEMLTEVEAPRL
jgi:MoxR-like ATPase